METYLKCPNVVTSSEGTSYCRLAEDSVKRLEKERDELKGRHEQWKKDASEDRFYRVERLEAEKHSLEERLKLAEKVVEAARAFNDDFEEICFNHQLDLEKAIEAYDAATQGKEV